MAAALLGEDHSPVKAKINTLMDEVDDVEKEQDHDYISKLITDHFSSKVFDIISDLMYKRSNDQKYGNQNVSDNDYSDEEEEEFDNGDRNRN